MQRQAQAVHPETEALAMGARRILSGEFVTRVDYRYSLSDLLAAGKYVEIHPDVLRTRFPVPGRGAMSVPIRLWPHEDCIGSDEAIAQISKAGFRPADHMQVLALRAQHGNIRLPGNEVPIVAAIGSIGRLMSRHGRANEGSDHRRVIVQDYDGDCTGGCTIGLGYYAANGQGNWRPRDWIAVVPV